MADGAIISELKRRNTLEGKTTTWVLGETNMKALCTVSRGTDSSILTVRVPLALGPTETLDSSIIYQHAQD